MIRLSTYRLPLLLFSFSSFLGCGSQHENVQANNDVFDYADSASPAYEYVEETPIEEEKTASWDTLLGGMRFDVDTVTIASKYLNCKSLEDGFPTKISNAISYMPESQREEKVCITTDNGLLETVTVAYDKHYPLVLSPDVIWLTICQGMAIHVNENFNSLERVMFKNGHPKEIVVRNDNLGKDSGAWSELVDSFSAQAKLYTSKDIYGAFVPKFSTTTPIEHVAYEITLMYAQQKAFRYVAESGCGIPYITLKGTTEDWVNIKRKLSVLDILGLAQWKGCLDPIIDQFIKASKGYPDREFWKNIYKVRWDYGDTSITGWIHQLFPYIILPDWENVVVVDSISGLSECEEKYSPNPFLDKGVTSSDDLTTDRFPSGIMTVPFVWNNHFEGVTKNMRFYAGFIGSKQYPDKSLEPYISWAVCED